MPTSRLIASVATCLLVIGLAACGNDGAGTRANGDGGDQGVVRVRIAHNSNAANLPARVAAERGFFKDEGLAVTFTVVENIATLPPALGRSFEIVQTAPTNMIAANSQGIPMVAVAGATVDVKDNPTAAVIASAASGITSIGQLQGRTLGVLNETGTLHTATRYWLEQAGVPLDSVKIVQIDGPAMADQLKAGRVDAVETIAPFRATILAQSGTVDLGDPYLQMAPELGAILWGAQKQWAEKNADAVAGFRSALAKAIDFIKANDKEARAILQEYTKLSDGVIAKTDLPTYTSELRPQDLDVWLKAMRAVGDFKGNVQLKDLVPTEN